MFRAGTVVSFLILGTGLSHAQMQVTAVELHIRESGGFLRKTFHEAGSKEAIAAVAAICAAYGTDCRAQAAAGGQILRETGKIDATYVATNAEIWKRDGQAWYGVWKSPPGHHVCKAQIDTGGASISGGASFSGQIFRERARPGAPPLPRGSGLYFYAVVPKNRPVGQSVEAGLTIGFVPASEISKRDYDCLPDDSVSATSDTWDCKGTGANACKVKPGAYISSEQFAQIKRQLVLK